MLVLLRTALIMGVGLTAVYWIVAAYYRSVRRERLERDWDENPPAGAGPEDRAAFIAKGMEVYRHGLRRRLIWLVYIIPLGAVLAVTWVVNSQ